MTEPSRPSPPTQTVMAPTPHPTPTPPATSVPADAPQSPAPRFPPLTEEELRRAISRGVIMAAQDRRDRIKRGVDPDKGLTKD